jgi:hypothetical protein
LTKFGDLNKNLMTKYLFNFDMTDKFGVFHKPAMMAHYIEARAMKK